MRFLPLALTLIAALLFAAPSSAHRPRNCSKLPARSELRCAHRQLHHARIEARAPIASPPHSRGYWLWKVRQARRWIKQAKWKLSHPPIAHRQLWECIHAREGAWNDPDSGHNSHYGGLQMTSPWGKGVYYVYRADWLTPYMQMRKAELGYIASGYSKSWALGQWNHPNCVASYG